jgi:hypothetical protein
LTFANLLASQTFVILWFDTEDFVNPETDDMPMRIAKIMERHDIKVVFKIVGEKLRALKKNRRNDVIKAISRHDIGYHSNLHSIHPTPSEYVGNLDWDRGASEFQRKERPGYAEIRRTFGKRPSCYGHQGLCWVPQAYPVLKKWGIPVYLDETFTISTLSERPFWYGNILNVMCLRSNVSTLDAGISAFPIASDWLSKFPSEFSKLYEKLQKEDIVGVISIYCHPTTYATAEWWEKDNFLHGRNPQGLKFKRAPINTTEKIEENLRLLESFVLKAKQLSNLRFITASEALKIYEDRSSGRKFSSQEVKALCKKGIESINYEKVGEGVWVSPAETFALVLEMLSKYGKTNKMPSTVRSHLHLFGPKISSETAVRSGMIVLKDFIRSCQVEFLRMRKSGYLPSSIKVGSDILSPIDMFATVCSVYLQLLDGPAPVTIQIESGIFEVGKMVTMEGAKIDWGYQLNPEGFEAPVQLEQARLQTWTLKPATPNL